MAYRLDDLYEEMDNAALHIKANTSPGEVATEPLRAAARELSQRPGHGSPVRVRADLAASQVRTALAYVVMAPDTPARSELVGWLQRLEGKLSSEVE